MDDANYRGGVVGDSPELCRAPDAHGFADLDRSFAFNCTLDGASGCGEEWQGAEEQASSEAAKEHPATPILSP